MKRFYFFGFLAAIFNSTGAYAQAAKVFKGDIYAGALVKP